MLAEFLKDQPGWAEVMPGACACPAVLGSETGSFPLQVPPLLEPMHFEALFCRSGAVTLIRRDGPPLTVRDREILLLTDASALVSAEIHAPLAGVLVAVNARGARESLHTLCGLLGGLALDTGRVRHWMETQGGCAAIGKTAWSQAAFEQMEALPPGEQGRYCVLKSVELLYLFCAPEGQGEASRPPQAPDRELVRTMEALRRYMEEHLGDPLTIPELSRRSLLSATALKDGFRRLYGRPVHAWLRQRRMERAAELLRTSQLSVLGVAQSVGYSSASQFGAAFRQQYGMTPGQYRKNV